MAKSKGKGGEAYADPKNGKVPPSKQRQGQKG